MNKNKKVFAVVKRDFIDVCHMSPLWMEQMGIKTSHLTFPFCFVVHVVRVLLMELQGFYYFDFYRLFKFLSCSMFH